MGKTLGYPGPSREGCVRAWGPQPQVVVEEEDGNGIDALWMGKRMRKWTGHIIPASSLAQAPLRRPWKTPSPSPSDRQQMCNCMKALCLLVLILLWIFSDKYMLLLILSLQGSRRKGENQQIVSVFKGYA